MKQFFRDYFTFNKRERNGVFVLISIILVLLLYLAFAPYFRPSSSVDFSEFTNDVEQFTASFKKGESASEATEQKYIADIEKDSDEGKTLPEYFNFNPNNLPDNDWKRLGLSDRQINTIKKYESRGGKFRTKGDVKKIYSISSTLYSSLEPFIQLPDEKNLATVSVPEKEKGTARTIPTQLIELNSADSAQLVSIKGIGPFYAKTIINYRSSIGGFVTKEQLMEVWKFDQAKFDEIKNWITVDASTVKKININTCEAPELKGRYIKWNVANAIVNYRKHHGRFATIGDIKKTDLVDEETYSKIAPYLILN